MLDARQSEALRAMHRASKRMVGLPVDLTIIRLDLGDMPGISPEVLSHLRLHRSRLGSFDFVAEIDGWREAGMLRMSQPGNRQAAFSRYTQRFVGRNAEGFLEAHAYGAYDELLLRGIPDDPGPFWEAWRHLYLVVGTAAWEAMALPTRIPLIGTPEKV